MKLYVCPDCKRASETMTLGEDKKHYFTNCFEFLSTKEEMLNCLCGKKLTWFDLEKMDAKNEKENINKM